MVLEAPTSLVAWEERRVATPRAAGVAGLLFAILFTVSIAIMHRALGDLGKQGGAWVEEYGASFSVAVGLVPFAGIFFLWFIGVVRARLGRFEDQFFSTVFTGSGLLFLAMMFVAAGVAGTIVVGYARDAEVYAAGESYVFARDLIGQIFTVYALRVAAVFLLSQATLWWRTRVMPRWLTIVTIPIALVLLFVFTSSFWVVFLFPAWVFLVSAYIMTVSFLHRPTGDGRGEALLGSSEAGPTELEKRES